MKWQSWVKWASWVDRGYYWDGVNWGRMGGWLVCWWGMGNSVIFHISHVAAIASDVSSVVDNLDAAVRKGHLVLASYNVGVGSLLLVKAGTRVVVVDAILKGIGLRWFGIGMDRLVNHRYRMDWQGVDWSWMNG